MKSLEAEASNGVRIAMSFHSFRTGWKSEYGFWVRPPPGGLGLCGLARLFRPFRTMVRSTVATEAATDDVRGQRVKAEPGSEEGAVVAAAPTKLTAAAVAAAREAADPPR